MVDLNAGLLRYPWTYVKFYVNLIILIFIWNVTLNWTINDTGVTLYNGCRDWEKPTWAYKQILATLVLGWKKKITSLIKITIAQRS